MSEHYIKRCKNCQTVIGQCRCMGPKKTIWEMCEKCKASQNKCDINKSNFSEGLVATVDGMDNVEYFICRLIDQCEGEIITEELLHRRYADFVKWHGQEGN